MQSESNTLAGGWGHFGGSMGHTVCMSLWLPAILKDMQTYTIIKRGRFWAVLDPKRWLIAVVVYKKGAQEILRQLAVQFINN